MGQYLFMKKVLTRITIDDITKISARELYV